MKRCPRCFSGQMWGELVYRAAGPAGQRFTCLMCGESIEPFPPLPALHFGVRRGRPPKARTE